MNFRENGIVSNTNPTTRTRRIKCFDAKLPLLHLCGRCRCRCHAFPPIRHRKNENATRTKTTTVGSQSNVSIILCCVVFLFNARSNIFLFLLFSKKRNKYVVSLMRSLILPERKRLLHSVFLVKVFLKIFFHIINTLSNKGICIFIVICICTSISNTGLRYIFIRP